MTGEAAKLVGHAYTIGFDLGNGRSIQVNGTFFVDDRPADMNEKLDHVMSVLERQRARCELEKYALELKQRRKMLKDNQELLVRIEAITERTKEQRRSVPAQELANIENTKTTIVKIKEDIAEGERALEEARQRAA